MRKSTISQHKCAHLLNKTMEFRILCLRRISGAWWKEITQHAVYNECTHILDSKKTTSLAIFCEFSIYYYFLLCLACSCIRSKASLPASQPTNPLLYELKFQNISNICILYIIIVLLMVFFSAVEKLKLFCDMYKEKKWLHYNCNRKYMCIVVYFSFSFSCFLATHTEDTSYFLISDHYGTNKKDRLTFDMLI